NLYPPLRMKPLISRANLCMKIITSNNT
ncbi:hypothetical protein K16_19775, partial [Klebsiella pneumoniae]